MLLLTLFRISAQHAKVSAGPAMCRLNYPNRDSVSVNSVSKHHVTREVTFLFFVQNLISLQLHWATNTSGIVRTQENFCLSPFSILGVNVQTSFMSSIRCCRF